MAESCPKDSSVQCCGPHIFTSVLLGILACVLMTGGVFLAFHRWDPLWLIVSGVGVVLVLIGSMLHCYRPSGNNHKGCCLPDHLHNHVVLNSLTEQLLPLSNARSVSQLSLNMLPGYFPPLVTAYGIEQHSAVVQNINHIIQQQQSQNPTSVPGKNFILLSLPGNTPQANIQNLVATVYQLDGSVLAETSNSSDVPQVITTATTAVPSHIPVLKTVEVQTSSSWSLPNSAIPATGASANICIATNEQNIAQISTQTENLENPFNLIDCATGPICDTSSVEVDVPEILVDVFEGTAQSTEPEVILASLIDSSSSSINSILEINSHEPPVSIPDSTAEVLVDISESSSDLSSNSLSDIQALTITTGLESDGDNNITHTEFPTSDINNIFLHTSTELLDSDTCNTAAASCDNNLETVSVSNQLDIVEDISNNNSSENSSLSLGEDIDSLGRSSPPPCYEEVALQRESPVGGFGLGYGTL